MWRGVLGGVLGGGNSSNEGVGSQQPGPCFGWFASLVQGRVGLGLVCGGRLLPVAPVDVGILGPGFSNSGLVR